VVRFGAMTGHGSDTTMMHFIKPVNSERRKLVYPMEELQGLSHHQAAVQEGLQSVEHFLLLPVHVEMYQSMVDVKDLTEPVCETLKHWMPTVMQSVAVMQMQLHDHQ